MPRINQIDAYGLERYEAGLAVGKENADKALVERVKLLEEALRNLLACGGTNPEPARAVLAAKEQP